MKKVFLFLFMFCGTFLVAQRNLSGVVKDTDGEALIGANVVVLNSTLGTVTDIDGSFSLEVPNDAESLEISYTGYSTQVISIIGQDYFDVALAEGELLEEVVVTGYQAIKKSEVTGSAVQLKTEAIAQVPVATVDQVLQGKVAGLAFSNTSGTPGSATNIRIRGVSSITAGNEPLYVIDGVPMVNPEISDDDSNDNDSPGTSSMSALASLSSDNIESITVLKDAASTAAYGARGANGVIVIKTKSGKSGKTRFSLSSMYGVSNDALDGPQVLSVEERKELAVEAFYNSFKDRAGFKSLEDAEKAYLSGRGAQYQRWIDGGKPDNNWGKEITNKNAPLRDINLSATGGGDGYTFYAGLGYFDQEATVIGSSFNRYTGQLNFSKDLSKSFKFNTNNSFSSSYQDGLLEQSAYFSSPRTAKFFMNPTNNPRTEDGEYNNNLAGSMPNPLYIARENLDDSRLNRFITNNSLTWQTPVENLVFKTVANLDRINYNLRNYRNPNFGDGAASNGTAYQSIKNVNTLVLQNSLDYNWNISDDHGMTFKLLQEWQKNKDYFLGTEAENFSDEGLYNLNSAGKPTSSDSKFYDWSIASYLFQTHYSGFEGRYVLDFTFRREGSSRFSPDNRWGNFWSVGGAWNLHREDFLADVDMISNLKLRVAYGVTGNAAVGLNRYQALINFDSDYNGEGASYPGTFGNSDLTWEKSNSFDVGVDFGLFNNRVNASVGYFNRVSSDLLLDVPLSLASGFFEQTRNIGRMKNSGVEVELDIDVVRSKDFNFSIGANVGTVRNEVTELAKDLNNKEVSINETVRRTASGHPVRAWYMQTWAGVNPETGLEEYYVNGVDGEKTTNFNAAKRVFQGGNATPTLTAGFNTNIEFKGLFVDAYFYHAGGHKVYEGWHRYLNDISLFSYEFFNGLKSNLNRWQKPGDVSRNGKALYTTRPWQRHSKFLYDGDYIRLKTLTVGYNLGDIVKPLGLSSSRIFVRGTNLWTWVKDKNLQYDPEVDETGFTGLTTPPVKSFILGLNVNF